MKRVFRGRSYDTDKAEKIEQEDNEFLYRKKTGEYFLYKEGIDSPSLITPLSYAEAQEWAEEHMPVMKIDKYFYDIIHTGKKAPLQLTLDKAVIEKMKRISVERGITISELVTRLFLNEESQLQG